MLPPNVPSDQSSLLIIKYPEKWLARKSATFAEFLALFDSALWDRNYRCTHCNEFCRRQHASVTSTFTSTSNEAPQQQQHSDRTLDDSFLIYQSGTHFYGQPKYLCMICEEVCCNTEYWKDDTNNCDCQDALKACFFCHVLACGKCSTFFPLHRKDESIKTFTLVLFITLII